MVSLTPTARPCLQSLSRKDNMINAKEFAIAYRNAMDKEWTYKELADHLGIDVQALHVKIHGYRKEGKKLPKLKSSARSNGDREQRTKEFNDIIAAKRSYRASRWLDGGGL